MIVYPADLMYIEEAVDALVESLAELSGRTTEIVFAYGRNRCAESSFLTKCQQIFHISEVSSSDLDEKYQCSDVRVLKLQKHGPE